LNQDLLGPVSGSGAREEKITKNSLKVQKFRFSSAGYYFWGLEASSVVWKFFQEA
jgi:hypothetical protein